MQRRHISENVRTFFVGGYRQGRPKPCTHSFSSLEEQCKSEVLTVMEEDKV